MNKIEPNYVNINYIQKINDLEIEKNIHKTYLHYLYKYYKHKLVYKCYIVKTIYPNLQK